MQSPSGCFSYLDISRTPRPYSLMRTGNRILLVQHQPRPGRIYTAEAQHPRRLRIQSSSKLSPQRPQTGRLIGNNATNEPVSNPLLQRGFTSSNVLNISFSFLIPQNYGNSSQQFFTLGYTNGTNTQTALRLYLGANYQGSTALGYQTSSGSRVNAGPAFVGEQRWMSQ